MSAANHFTDAYKNFKASTGEYPNQFVVDPGSGGTFDLKGKDKAYTTIASGTRVLPDNVPMGVDFRVYATGSVTLTNVLGATVKTLASGEYADCTPLSSTTWAATNGVIGNTLPSNTAMPAASITIADAGTYTDRTTVEAALQSIMRDMQVIEFPITTFAINGVTPLAAFANNAAANPGLALDNSEAIGVRFNNSSTQDQVLWSTRGIPLGALTATAAPVLNVLASKSGATLADATTFVVTAFCQATGALHDAGVTIGGNTSAMTGNATAKTVQKVTLTLTNFSEALAGPLPVTTDAALSLSIAPNANTLNTDDVTIHRVWITYDSGLT